VREAFSPQAQQRANQLVEDVRAAMRTRIGALAWMSAPTKARALAKLEAMTAQIGAPATWPDYSALNLVRDEPAANAMRVAAWGFARQAADLARPVDRARWNTSPHIVNAFAAGLNRIVFPAGILQPPFFDAAADDATNYGGIGMVIGHEIIHHFDDRGRQYDADGNLADWWAPEDAAAYKARADRVVELYGRYEPLPGLRIDGRQMLGENISDLGGLQIAFDAYRLALKRKPAPVIDGRTAEQRFFVANAVIWRNQQRAQALEQQIRTGQHSPGRYRVLGPMSQMPAFAQAFGCRPGDPMVAADPVAVW
jgi:predicted metalloendopeptidase